MKKWFSYGVLAMGLLGCDSAARGPYLSTGEQQRDQVRAESLYREAKALLADESSESARVAAEKCLREALAFDIYHGPAHNNLGVLLLKQDRLYDAAEEFEWARKLLPGNPEPRVNLAIALDRGGKHVDAIDAARAALEVAPGNLAAIETIALVQVREGLKDSSLPTYLAAIAQRGDPVWQGWAKNQQLRSIE